MRPIYIVVLTLVFTAFTAAQTIKPLTNLDVIRLTQAGLSEQLILKRIETSAKNFDLGAPALIELKRAKVSERVIAAMMGAPAAPAAPASRDTPRKTAPLPASESLGALRGHTWAEPESFGIFWEAGSQLRQIPRTQKQVRANKGRAILSNGTLGLAVKSRSMTRLDGTQSVNRVPSDAVFVLHLSEPRIPNIRLVKTLVRQGEREVAVLNKVYSTSSAEDHGIGFAIVKLKPELYRLLPKQPLDRGEYAFVDISAANQASLLVYDFGVN